MYVLRVFSDKELLNFRTVKTLKKQFQQIMIFYDETQTNPTKTRNLVYRIIFAHFAFHRAILFLIGAINVYGFEYLYKNCFFALTHVRLRNLVWFCIFLYEKSSKLIPRQLSR